MALKRINLNLDTELVKMLDDYANRMHVNRTVALTVILSQYFEQKKAVSSVGSFVDMMKSGKLGSFDMNDSFNDLLGL